MYSVFMYLGCRLLLIERKLDTLSKSA